LDKPQYALRPLQLRTKAATLKLPIDRLKEELAYIRYYISVAITVAIAISGWLVMNIEEATKYAIDHLGDKNANTLTGTSRDEIFVAGAGDDTLTGNHPSHRR
jgi:hypothetical protein